MLQYSLFIEMFCTIAGADPYSSRSPYSYSLLTNKQPLQEMRTSQFFIEVSKKCFNMTQIHNFRKVNFATFVWPTPQVDVQPRIWSMEVLLGGKVRRCPEVWATMK